MFEGKYIVGKDDNFIISPAINTNMKEIEENLIMFSDVRSFSEKKNILSRIDNRQHNTQIQSS